MKPNTPAQPNAPAPEPPDRLRDVARKYSAALHIVAGGEAMTAREIGAKVSLAYAVKSGGTLSEIAAAEIEPLMSLAQDLREALRDATPNVDRFTCEPDCNCSLRKQQRVLARADEILGKP